MKRRLIESLIIILLVSTLLYGAVQTIETLPSNNSAFIATLNNFLRAESADRYRLIRDPGSRDIYTGGTAPVSANLTHTISAVTGFPYGYYSYKASTSHTYTASTRTFVYLDYDSVRTITIAGAAVTRATYLVFAEMTAGSTQPVTPTGSIILMQVDTGPTAITAVSDLRYSLCSEISPDWADFGADPTGHTNSSTAITSAIAASPAGSTLKFGLGTYLINSAVTVNKWISVKGAPGQGTILKAAAGMTGDMLTQTYVAATPPTSTVYEDFVIDCNNTARDGLVTKNLWGSQFSRITTQKCTRYGVFIDNTGNYYTSGQDWWPYNLVFNSHNSKNNEVNYHIETNSNSGLDPVVDFNDCISYGGVRAVTGIINASTDAHDFLNRYYGFASFNRFITEAQGWKGVDFRGPWYVSFNNTYMEIGISVTDRSGTVIRPMTTLEILNSGWRATDKANIIVDGGYAWYVYDNATDCSPPCNDNSTILFRAGTRINNWTEVSDLRIGLDYDSPPSCFGPPLMTYTLSGVGAECSHRNGGANAAVGTVYTDSYKNQWKVFSASPSTTTKFTPITNPVKMPMDLTLKGSNGGFGYLLIEDNLTITDVRLVVDDNFTSSLATVTSTFGGNATNYTQVTLNSGASAVNGYYIGWVLQTALANDNGTLDYIVSDYDGASKLLTLSYPVGTKPKTGQTYYLYPGYLTVTSGATTAYEWIGGQQARLPLLKQGAVFSTKSNPHSPLYNNAKWGQWIKGVPIDPSSGWITGAIPALFVLGTQAGGTYAGGTWTSGKAHILIYWEH